MFFRHQGERIVGKTGHPFPGIDPRRGRLAVTIPPSIHIRTRTPYRWLVAPWELSPPPAPVWLLKLVHEPEPPPLPRREPSRNEEYADRKLREAMDFVATAPTGGANDTLNRQAFFIGKLVGKSILTDGHAMASLVDAARARGMPVREALATIRSAFSAGARR